MTQKNEACHKDHRKRMRKRFLEHGFQGFAEHEILELLLFFAIPRCDTNPLAHKVLNEYKTLANALDASYEDLVKIPGMGENSAVLLSMIPQLFRAYETSKYGKDCLLHDSCALGEYAVSMFRGKKKEEFALICLDSNRRVRWSGSIISGTIDRLEAYPRVVVEEVLKHNAKTVVFVHNHPNGALRPSAEDRQTTKILVDILDGIGVRVIDHIIVSDGRFYSMAETGTIF